MLTKLDANQWTEAFLKQLQCKNFYQKHAAFEYSTFLATGQRHLFNWTKINNAIINKWSKAGLKRVKEAAWSNCDYDWKQVD